MDVKSDCVNGSWERNGLQEMGNQKFDVSDHHHHHHHHHHMNGFKYENGGNKSDSFVVDLESFSNGVEKEPPSNSTTSTTTTTSSNSRITLQRSLSRKGPQRGVERKINTDRDPLAPSSSPRAAQVVSSPEKSLSPLNLAQPAMGSPDHSSSANNHHQQQLPQHQIAIKTGGVNTLADGRWGKRSSFKRSSPSWFSDPKRILLFFATLSSMGTILLIYFTLSMSKPNEKEGVLDWQ